MNAPEVESVSEVSKRECVEWGALDQLARAVGAFRSMGQADAGERKKALQMLVVKVGETMPPAVRKQMDWEFEEAQSSLTSTRVALGGVAGMCDRWKDKIAHYCSQVAPEPPSYEPNLLKKSVGNRQRIAYQTVTQELTELVANYYGPAAPIAQNFPHVHAALQPYRFALALQGLRQAIKSKKADETFNYSAAVTSFIDDPENAAMLKDQGALAKRIEDSKGNDLTRSLLLNVLRPEVHMRLLPSAKNDGVSYSDSFVRALRKDVVANYKGDSSRMALDNDGEAWLDTLYAYRWATAAREVAKAVSNEKALFRPQRAEKPKGFAAAEDARGAESTQPSLF